MYFLTLIYGIWDVHLETSTGEGETHKTTWAIISTTIFTFFFAMMFASHVLTVLTNPGEMPTKYEHLHEEDLPKQFYDLLHLRESMYAELVVKKKMR